MQGFAIYNRVSGFAMVFPIKLETLNRVIDPFQPRSQRIVFCGFGLRLKGLHAVSW